MVLLLSPYFFGYLNSIDKTGKTNFTMEILSDTGLECLDLKLKIVEGKIRIDIFVKPTKTFSYTTRDTCHPKIYKCNIPKDIALTL